MWRAACSRFRANTIRALAPRQPPAAFALGVHLPEIRFEDSIPRAQTGCTRAKMPPHYCSNLRLSIVRRVGTLVQSEFSSWGVPSRKSDRRAARWRATMSHAQVWGERHEGSHQKGGLGSICAHAGGDGDARHRQRRVLLAMKAVRHLPWRNGKRSRGRAASRMTRPETGWGEGRVRVSPHPGASAGRVASSFCEIGNEAAGERNEPRGDAIADDQIMVAMGHHSKTL